jgi:hypothetical protein
MLEVTVSIGAEQPGVVCCYGDLATDPRWGFRMEVTASYFTEQPKGSRAGGSSKSSSMSP